MSTQHERIILITGANRGIGLAILSSLALHPKFQVSTFLLGCRDLTAGDAAISELRVQNIPPTPTAATIHSLELDVTSDSSLAAAVDYVKSTYGRLDILVNNAGIAVPLPVKESESESDLSAYRSAFQETYNTNVSSVALCTMMFLPVLRLSSEPRIINVSSARGSISLSASGALPPTVNIPYSISKTALNALTVEMSRDPKNKDVMFQAVSPGHCRTGFNGWRGAREPSEGAGVVVELCVREKDEMENAGFWETKGESRELLRVPW